MTIKNRGGVFGRNPTFNNVDVDGTLSIAGTAVPAPADTLTTSDIGSTVQAYDADTAKLDVAQTFTAQQDFPTASATSFGVGVTSPPRQFTVQATGSGDNLPVRIIGGSAASQCYIELHDAATTADYNVRVGSAGDDLELYAGGSNRLDVRSNGDVSVQAGNLIIGTSGKGIDFSATAGTGTSELFSDYEEGLWTPVYQTTGTPFDAITHSIQNGFYRKVGNLVVVNFFLRTSSVTVGSATGLVVVGGLPYTPADTVGPGGAVVNTFGWGVNAPRAVRASPLGILYLSYNSLASRTTDVSTSDIGAATYNDCYATCIYYT